MMYWKTNEEEDSDLYVKHYNEDPEDPSLK